MIVHGLKSCDTTRAALKALTAAGKSPEFRDLRDNPPDMDEIGRLLSVLGPAVLNRGSTTWRALSEAQKAADPAALLQAHPTLIKRPVIEEDGRMTLGWGRAVQALWL